jgi:hypothetical protein
MKTSKRVVPTVAKAMTPLLDFELDVLAREAMPGDQVTAERVCKSVGMVSGMNAKSVRAL